MTRVSRSANYMRPHCSFEYLATRIQEIAGMQEYLLLREMARRVDRPLWTAFDALGLDRVVAGARALHADNEEWKGCFLALAYGERGDLVESLNKRRGAREISHTLGIRVEDVKAIVRYFDSDIAYFKAELVEWLQAQGANPAMVLRETRREVRIQDLAPARQSQAPDLLKQLSEEQVELLNAWLAYVGQGMPSERTAGCLGNKIDRRNRGVTEVPPRQGHDRIAR